MLKTINLEYNIGDTFYRHGESKIESYYLSSIRITLIRNGMRVKYRLVNRITGVSCDVYNIKGNGFYTTKHMDV